ncbi:glycosyltransferase family 1 protein [Amylocystis lapponica]|nr:glycosyltransferase family 1 protein [Amylocystis lapponica]
MAIALIHAVVVALSCLVLRIYCILPGKTSAKPRGRSRTAPCRTAVFLGSGGHTSEMLMLVSSLDFGRYFPRTYIVSAGDTLSTQKAVALESLKAADRPPSPNVVSGATFITIPRARRVHQTLLTTPLTAACSLVVCVYHISISPLFLHSSSVDVLILNGPGTCFVLCMAAYLNRLFGLPSPKLIYVESFARVRSLSLSGLLLRPFVDRFVVQWPDLLKDGRRGDCRGWLV